LAKIAEWSVANFQGFCPIFTKNKADTQLKGTAGIARQYGNEWLIFCPAKDFVAAYNQWLALVTKKLYSYS
jgi:hypothetical protein